MRRYESPEHESLRAVVRCLVVNFGPHDALRRANDLFRYMGVTCASHLSPDGASYCRKFLAKALPLRGDFA